MQSDPRILEVAAGGSLLSATMDEYSDQDLIVVATDDACAQVKAQRLEIAAWCWSTKL